MEENVLRLTKPKKKGLLGIVFSRTMIIVLLLIIQIMLYLSFLIWLRQYFAHYAVVQTIFVVIMILYLFNNTMDSTAKLTWLGIIAVAPVLGTLLLYFTQTNIGHRTVRQRVEKQIENTKELLKQDAEVLEELKGDPYATDDLHRYINRSGCFPIYKHTKVTYFPCGEDKFEAMLAELEKANKYIYLEYFIVEEGYMWGRILDILIRKAKEGVDVRVMYDGTCEITTLPHNYPELLEEKGIHTKPFAPVKPFLSTHYNYRDHRKILVIDGKVAFNGGVNLADEYINRIKKYGHWKDNCFRIEGEAVWSYTVMFLTNWNALRHEDEDYLKFKYDFGEETEMDGYIAPYADTPLDNELVGQNVYLNIINQANNYVYIATPYLVIDTDVRNALVLAAKRGVDVRIITPGIPDKKIVYQVTRSFYEHLINGGVKIYEYTPGFIHSKVFVSDDKIASTGTINLDFRSLYLHFENNTYLYNSEAVLDIKKDMTDTMALSREIHSGEIRFGLIKGMLIATVRIFSGLL